MFNTAGVWYHTRAQQKEDDKKSFSQKQTTPAGLEPTRENPNRFLVDRLNRSATVSYSYQCKQYNSPNYLV